MRNNILAGMGILVLIGFAIQGIFGVAGAILICAIVGLCYGIFKKDKQFIRWSSVVLIIDIFCIIAFYICLLNSDM